MTPEFMEILSEILKEELNVSGPEWEPENLYRLATQVKTGLIRTEADELTYPIHVILRWKLEQQLIDGTLEPKDLPAAWKKGMKDMLGVDVPDDAVGCMQDVHWPYGLFGDFPGYTFGAQGASQLGEKIREDIPDFKQLVRKGDFAPIRKWLTENIHRHGSMLEGSELIEQATDKKFSSWSWFKQMAERMLGVVLEMPWAEKLEVRAANQGPVLAI
jgi:carboxypeptidase Taq